MLYTSNQLTENVYTATFPLRSLPGLFIVVTFYGHLSDILSYRQNSILHESRKLYFIKPVTIERVKNTSIILVTAGELLVNYLF